MDPLEFISTRRSIRKYSLKPVEWEKIITAIDIATTAPSAGNLQPWRFIIIEDSGIQAELYEYCYEQPWVYNAPALVAVVADIERCKSQYGERGYEYAIESVSAAIQNFLLALHALGLGAVWVSGFEQREVDEVLGVPAGKMTIALIAIGYPAEQPEPKTIFDLKTRIYFNKYGFKVSRVWKLLRNYRAGREEAERNIKKWFKRILGKPRGVVEKYQDFIATAEGLEGKQKVAKLNLKREKGWLYFIDSDGDVARVPMKWKEKKEKEEDNQKNL
ncbi:nitroreductase family protein [Candidatus Woesearchaeota archaeon]|nr:nitroreductase family protein [Candidatus Woesearchaeota archaeon]